MRATTRPRLDLLMSRPYIVPEVVRALIEYAEVIRLFVDCGAVTAYAKGKRVDLDGYCRFLDALPVQPWKCIALDEIGNPEATMKNYALMRSRGFAPVPVYTRKAPPEHLAYFCETSDVVAVGGLATKAGAPYAYAAKIMEQTNGHAIHLLGMTSIGWLRTIRPFSADSSSWESAARYGSFDLYMGAARMLKLNREDFRQRPADEVMDRVMRMGVDPNGLRFEAAWRGGKSLTRQISAASWVWLARELQNKVGTSLFLAAANEEAMMALVRAHIRQTGGPSG